MTRFQRTRREGSCPPRRTRAGAGRPARGRASLLYTASRLAASRRQALRRCPALAFGSRLNDARCSNVDRALKLERPRSEQEIDDAALVRLQPVQLDRRHRAEIESIDVRSVQQGPLKLLVLSDH